MFVWKASNSPSLNSKSLVCANTDMVRIGGGLSTSLRVNNFCALAAGKVSHILTQTESIS